MVNWCNVVTEFTVKEELLSCLSESRSSHYESSSIALILPNGEVTECITVKASTSAGCLCVAISRTLILFDCASKKVVQCISFESNIDGYCMAKNNSVLVVALRNGYLHCLLVGRDQKLFERKFDDQDSEILPTFVGLHAESDDSLILVGRKGKIFRIPGLLLHTSNESFNYVNNETQSEFLCDLKSEVCCLCLSRSVDGSPVLMIGSSCYFYLSDDLFKIKTVLNVDVEEKHTKILSNKSASLIICLREEKLMLYCSITLICLKMFDEAKVLDFTVVDGMENEDLLLVSLLDEDGRNVMKLLAASDFSCKLQFKAHHPFMVDFPFIKDNLIILDGTIKDDSNGELIDGVMVKSIEESNPLNRLTQLLRKKLFQEAERFAAQYGLDFQEIYQAQCLHCMESMQHMDKFSEYSHLIFLFDKIENVEFIVNLSLNFTLADLSAFKSLLLYCMEKLQVYEDKENVKFNMLMQDVSHHLHLVDTFTMLWRPNDNESWTLFSKGNILESFCRSLFRGEWMEAWVIWERHWDQCIQELDSVDNVIIILEKLPPGVFPQDLFTILAVFFHKVISHFPDASAAIAPWVISKIISLERLKDWPKDALYFGECMLSYLNCCDKYSDHNIILTKKFATGDLKFSCDSLNSLCNVIESLKYIQYFDSEFRVKIKLSDCDHEKKESLANMLLWKVCPDDYDKLFSGFLVKYLVQHQLSLDHVIKENVEGMLSYISPYWSSGNETHLEKAVALTEYIKDTQIKGNCILLIMNASPVPWNIRLSTLVNYGVMLDHPIAETIKLQLNLINVKSVLKKYNLDKCHLIYDFQMIIGHIIQLDGSEMIQDCLSVALFETKKEEVYTRCAKHYIQKREFEKAFKMLELLPKQTFLTILQRIIHGIHAASLIIDLNGNKMNYVNILKLIDFRFESVLIELDEGQYTLTEIPLKKLSGYYFMKEYFNFQLPLEDVELNSSNIDTILSNVTVNYDEKDSNNGILVQVKQLSEVFSWTVEAILIYILRKNGNDAVLFHVMRQLTISLIEDFDGEVDFLRWILSAILGQLLNEELGQSLQRILCKHLSMCHPRDLPIVLEICAFLRIWLCTDEASDKRSRRLHSETLQNFIPLSYDIVHVGHSKRQELWPPLELLSGITRLENHRQLWFDLVSKKKSSEPFYYSGCVKSNSSSKLSGEHYQGSWLTFQTDSLITWSSGMKCCSENAKSSSIKALLRRLESSKQYDLIVLIGLLLCFDWPLPITWINRSISRCIAELDCMQLHAILAIMFCDTCDISEEILEYENIYHNCLMEKRLKELGMSITDTECSQMHKMTKIMSLKKITAANLEEFCFLLHLEMKDVFLKFMQHLVLSWTPIFTVKVLRNGQEEYTLINSVDHILKTFNFFSPRIKKEDMNSFLQDIWKKVNLYYYEVYEVILEIMMSLNLNPQFVMEQKDMIRFLNTYHRKSLPSPTELDAFDDMRTLPEVSKWRLPLLTTSCHCVEQIFTSLTASSSFAGSIIAAEVNFQNYSKWLKAPPIDGFNPTTICIMAIKNEVNSHLKEYKKVEWQIYLSEEIFLQNLKECTMQIENLHMATAILYYVIPKLPPGVDQLVAAEICLSLAKKWIETGVELEEAKIVLQKVEKIYLNLGVMQILYQNGFGHPKYLEMIDNPIELITTLYYNADFGSYIMETKDYGVNYAAGQIANLFSTELVKLKFKLISTWLLPKEEFFDLNYSFTGGELFANEREIYSLANSDDMRRLFHICKSLDKNEIMNYLVSMAFPEDNISLPNIVKLRLMLCMCKVDYDCAAEQTALRGIMDLGTYIMKLFLLIPLERIGVVHSLEEFDSLDMFCLARSILQKDPMKYANISLAAKFCLTMEIFHHLLWEEILKSMIVSSMHEALVELLPLLRLHSPFIAIQIYRAAWKEALEAPFVKANIPMTSEEEQKCWNSLKIFHLCPILTDVDFDGIAEHCLKRSKNDMAALVLPFLSSSSRCKFRKQILDTDSVEDITTRLQSLSQQLHVCISKVLTFLQT